jgi:poly(beta-D-mannuronate) lyase
MKSTFTRQGRFQAISMTAAAYFTLAVVSSAASPASSGALRSPWDERPVTVTSAGYTCDVPPALPKDIAAYDFYSDAKHSVIDPTRYAAYNAAAKSFDDVMHAAESAADNFQSTGSRAAADCVLHVLLLNAQAGAMTGNMASNQSYYVQNWTLGSLAVTWLKVRDADPGTPDDRSAIAGWLQTVAHSTQGYFADRHQKGTTDAQNNHYYWAGFAVMAAGVAANDHSLFDWGVSTYDDGISRIQPDGTLALEMARGQRALHYHLFALAPLVTMAEFGAANNLDLYTRNHSALSLLIYRAMGGLEDNKYFTSKAGAAQDTPENGKVKSDEVVWLTPYLRRYPNGDLNRLLHSVNPRPYNYLGGLPPQ